MQSQRGSSKFAERLSPLAAVVEGQLLLLPAQLRPQHPPDRRLLVDPDSVLVSQLGRPLWLMSAALRLHTGKRECSLR